MTHDGGALRARPPTALYVHFPFCLSICPYCDFVVYAGRAARSEGGRRAAFLEALLVEIELRARAARRAFGALPPLRSVYIGGGTPSLLDPLAVERILAAADAGFGIAAGAEVTLEANPGPRERGDLHGFRTAGANRLSIGAQSMDAAELRGLGRRHLPADVVETVRLARAAGFASIGLDLLYDVPGQSLASWRRTLDAATALEPDHVSSYALTLDDPDADGLTGPAGDHLPLRRGAREWRRRARTTQDEDRAAACYEAADEHLGQAGMGWYELSNWAVTGHESRHNMAYWQGLAHEAVGPGAHRFDGARTRSWNAARLDAYIAALLPADGRAPTLAPGGTDIVDGQTAAAEKLILGLRTSAGIAASVHAPAVAASLAWGRSTGMLEANGRGGLRLSMRGRQLASELFWRLLPDADRPAA